MHWPASVFHVQCIITPALAGSKIVVEAYKKFVLVSLLVDGEVFFFTDECCVCFDFVSRLQRVTWHTRTIS